jgi:hypothetical protein
VDGRPGVRGTVAAADGVAQAIASFHRSATPLAEGAAAAVKDAERRAVRERDDRKRVLDRAIQERQRAEDALAACDEGCEGLRRAAQAARQAEEVARERHERSERAVVLTAEVGARLARQTRTFVLAVEHSSVGGQRAAAYRDHLQGYLAGGAASGAGPSASRTQISGSAAAGAVATTLLMAAREGILRLGIDVAERSVPMLKPDGMDASLLTAVADVVRDPGLRRLAQEELTAAASKVLSRLGHD